MGDDKFITKREIDFRWQGHDEVHALGKLALEKADHALERRLESMNQFRDQLNQQAATFQTRENAKLQEQEKQRVHDLLNNRLSTLEQWRAGLEGKLIGICISLSVIGFVLTLIVNVTLTLSRH